MVWTFHHFDPRPEANLAAVRASWRPPGDLGSPEEANFGSAGASSPTFRPGPLASPGPARIRSPWRSQDATGPRKGLRPPVAVGSFRDNDPSSAQHADAGAR